MATTTKQDIRDAAEADLLTFIKLVSPERVLGQAHEDVCHWWTRQDAKDHQLLLFPRDHQKSVMIAFRVAWSLAKDPTLRILYISATSGLAEKQLNFIKQILTSNTFTTYWPNYVNKDKGKREKWTNSEISLDHPRRKEEKVSESSVFTAGLTTSMTGFHCDIAVLDDIVVQENAYTKEGRNKVQGQYSLLASIESTEAKEWVVGTRYHPKDLYSDMIDMVEEVYSDDDDKIGEESIYEVMERAVEDNGDGTGEFLWPRSKRLDGKWFGFDIKILAKKRGKYLDRMQYRAQYYNDPSDPDNQPIASSRFQYYDRAFVTVSQGKVYYKNNKLNVVAAIDFAFSHSKAADYTAIVVVGCDHEGNLYVLDIQRFKTDKISDYYKEIVHMMEKWSFSKLRAEVTVAQAVIARDLKQRIKEHGLSLKVDEYRPKGNKEERMAAILEPRYDNLSIWHYRGGLCRDLEDELVTVNPAHDDIKDALSAAIEIVVKPASNSARARTAMGQNSNVIFNQRFGGRG